ncbi:enterotoxin [Bacillus cereus]|uniref:Enterotoxin n=1 Tax=Bacillus cereus TaxID=1396 RepID=A0A2A8LLZ3_BACCE|nr:MULTISPECIES: HBL/NHE enterotoxin family protein [Bacillus cereus group]MDR4986906.1 HBL/NHE enterotoxin family protein [Bacillus cereus]PES94578.1 enterotoxin [Bacillus cereus]PFP75208.1 enterotoxin [Bacillus cereus]
MKKPYKVMALSALIATMAAGSIMPSYASAAGNTTTPAPIAENKYDKYSLGPKGLKDALKQTGSHMLVMDLYALTVITQSNLNFDGVTALNDDLKTSINQKIGVARGNAQYWLDNMKPQIIQVNQNIIGYNTRFQAYQDDLVKDVNYALENAKNNNNVLSAQDKEPIKNRITTLNRSIQKNKEAANKLVTDLTDFRNKLVTDSTGLQNDAEKISNTLTSNETGIPLKMKQIEANQKTIDENTKIMILSAFAIAAGPIVMATPFFMFGIPMIAGGIYGTVVTKQQIEKSQQEIMQLTSELSSMQQQVTKLVVLKNNTNNLTGTINEAITATENIKKQWETIGAKYETLLNDIDFISADALDSIVDDIDIAKNSWNDVKKSAEDIQKSEISFVEEKK